MSADYIGTCPACGGDTFCQYQEFYIRNGVLHADWAGDCRDCQYEAGHDFEPWPLPNLPEEAPDIPGFTGVI